MASSRVTATSTVDDDPTKPAEVAALTTIASLARTWDDPLPAVPTRSMWSPGRSASAPARTEMARETLPAVAVAVGDSGGGGLLLREVSAKPVASAAVTAATPRRRKRRKRLNRAGNATARRYVEAGRSGAVVHRRRSDQLLELAVDDAVLEELLLEVLEEPPLELPVELALEVDPEELLDDPESVEELLDPLDAARESVR